MVTKIIRASRLYQGRIMWLCRLADGTECELSTGAIVRAHSKAR